MNVLDLNQWYLCLEAATRAGHSVEEALKCQGCELECLFCPFEEDGEVPGLQRNDMRFPLGHFDDLGVPR